MTPLAFQRRFVRAATRPGVDTAALSIPRGNGKTALAGHVLARGLTPGDPLHVAGAEYLLCAGSVDQARLCFRFVRAALEPSGLYRLHGFVPVVGGEGAGPAQGDLQQRQDGYGAGGRTAGGRG